MGMQGGFFPEHSSHNANYPGSDYKTHNEGPQWRQDPPEKGTGGVRSKPKGPNKPFMPSGHASAERASKQLERLGARVGN